MAFWESGLLADFWVLPPRSGGREIWLGVPACLHFVELGGSVFLPCSLGMHGRRSQPALVSDVRRLLVEAWRHRFTFVSVLHRFMTAVFSKG